MKPSILIIADFPNWAYYEIQQFVKNNVSDEFDIYCDYLIFNTLKKSKHPIRRLKTFQKKLKYQQIKKDNNYDIVVYLGFYFDELMKINWDSKKIIKGIYTDGFPPKNSKGINNFHDFNLTYLQKTDAIVCGSQQILNCYKKKFKNAFYANSALNQTLFKRETIKSINTKEEFIIGWTGNPKREFKGYYSHIIPAVNLAKKKYPKIKLKSRFSGPIETLPHFYNDTDVIIIASEYDAGPSMFGEASLMDVPAISTDIGWPHEVIKDGKNGVIVKRDIQQIANKIIALYENRELLYTMSKQIRKDYLTIFNTQEIAQNWKNIFNEVLRK